MQDKTRLTSSKVNTNNNSVYILDAKHVYDVSDTEGNKLKFNFNVNDKELVILGVPVDAIYIHFENKM